MTEPTSSLERERKLTAPDDLSADDLASTLQSLGTVKREPVRKLTAVYYDTDDYRLARARITLRRRTGGNDAGWHLKLPPDELNGDGRHEVTLPLRAGPPGQVPTALSDSLIAITAGAELRPLATQLTRRLPFTVTDASGASAVEVVDDTVTVTEGRHAGAEYRELEVEVLSSPELLEPTVQALTHAGAAPSASKSKGVRALVGDVELPPLVDPGPRPKPKDPASAAVAFHVRTQVAAIIEQDQRVRRQLPDAVHQYRVAARRLRSVLQAFLPLVDEEWARHLREELDWIASVMGQSRDREVLEQRLVDAVRTLPAEVDAAAALVAIQKQLDAELDEANASIDEALKSERYRRLMQTLHAASADPPTTSLAEGKAMKVLPPLVEARWRKLAKRAKKLHNEMDGHDEHWHKARILAKKARYTVEACIPVFGSPAKKLAKQLETVTDLLGEHQDAAMAAALLQQLATSSRGSRSAFALGILYAQQRQQVAQCRARFVESWPGVSHSKWRAWMEPKK
ncbi:MAG TPA: CYTH and CHAD domain-containing protein [Actinomycetes bacterium]|nr:CYTH and CHAD domain-containing protein [Actinomycetes bacterium]